jgi:two-component system NtrC family sensor kinase
LRREAGAEICAIVAGVDAIGLVSYAVDSSGEAVTNFLHKTRFRKLLELLPPQISTSTENPREFLLSDKKHNFEYVSPIHTNGEVRGFLAVGFGGANECTNETKRVVDAVAQLVAMSANLTSFYETQIEESISSTREEHRKFTDTVLDALPVSIYVIDRDYKIVSWNRHREVGDQGVLRDLAIGRNVFDVLTKQPAQKLKREFERAFRTGQIERIEQRTTSDAGATIHWIVSKVPMRDPITREITHVITVGEDVTMRVEAIHAAGRAEKLAAIGRLAAGVVHEINNPLATISACAESLETRIDDGVSLTCEEIKEFKEYLSLIRSEAFRCKNITTGLLDFSRVKSGNMLPIDIAEVLNSSARLVAHQKRGERIEIKVELSGILPKANADEGKIQQAIIALATNAIDAMPDGGTLTFSARQSGNFLEIEISDTGIGISPENVSKIFEPFFTTKEIGKGTGLGLAVAYGIITEHGGRLSVRSTVGIGSTFTITLPIKMKNSRSSA